MLSVNSSIREAEPVGVMWDKKFIIEIGTYTTVGENVMVKICKGGDSWRIRESCYPRSMNGSTKAPRWAGSHCRPAELLLRTAGCEVTGSKHTYLW